MNRTPIVVAGLAGALALAGSLTALGSTRDTVREVRVGESIQAAIDAAHPGDTVRVAAGTYRENVTITKDGITLRGAGAGEGGTVLLAPATPHESPCNESGEVNGICIAGEFELGTERVGTPVHGVHVSDLTVRGFSRFGVVVYNAVNTTVARVDTAHNHRYGLVGFTVDGIGVLDSRSHDNAEGGFYIGDSPQANAVFVGNAAYRNAVSEGIGLFLRDTSGGVVRDNRLEGNCSGMLLVDTAGDGPLAGWDVRHNTVTRNTAACAPSEDVPVPLSGVGIGLLGTDAVNVTDNTVTANRPTADTMLAGGIVLASARSVGGADPKGTVVHGNTSRGNGPTDVAFDGSGTGNRVSGNRCGTSLPAGLCG
jgi:nitrous oxidase accessory protein NosD